MSKTKTVELEILPPGGASVPASRDIPLTERRDRILTYHTGCKRSAEQQVLYAFLCGLELLQAKDQIPHGNKGPEGGFLKWREEHLPDLSKGSVVNYMALAKALTLKVPTVGTFATTPLLLTNGDLPAAERATLLEAIHDATQGSSLVDLYRELGVIKKPKKPGYTAPKELTPDQAAALLEQQAEDHLDDCIASHELTTAELLGRAPDAARQRYFESLLTQTKLLRSLKKTKKQNKVGRGSRRAVTSK